MSPTLIALCVAIAIYVVAIGVPLISLVRYSRRRGHPRHPMPNYSTAHIAELLVASSAVTQSADPGPNLASPAAA